ncbi:MAG TPA: ankyrin repeat domain-containing protein [Gammaproteobacteria bacterium]|nr:ankyrin repeat domain-containing protein [Gammaproteobacteria bacterium]
MQARAELLQAIKNNDEKAVERLITQTNVSEEFKSEELLEDKQTPIQLAAKLGHWDCVEAIAKNAETDPSDTARYGYALYEAVVKNRLDMVMLLMSTGASTGYGTKTGGCLHQAARKGHAEILCFLLPLFDVSNISKKSEENLTPIELAWKSGHWNCVIAIARLKKADDADNKAIYSKILFDAVRDNHINTARTLLQAGAPLPPASVNGNSPLHFAARHGNKDMIALLLSFGASTTAKNHAKQTPTQLAASLDLADVYTAGWDIYMKAEALKVTTLLMLFVQTKRRPGSFFHKLPNTIIESYLLRFLCREIDPVRDTVDFTNKCFTRISRNLSKSAETECKKQPEENKDTYKLTIGAVTSLPPPLVSLIHNYIFPSPEIVAAVNKDLNLLRHIPTNWTGISIMITACNIIDSDDKKHPHWLNLQNLQLDGIIFTSELLKVKNNLQPYAQLQEWRKLYLYPSIPPIIDLRHTSLIGAKFENLLCAPFWFEHAILTGASFKSSILNLRFVETKLNNADFSFCQIICPDNHSVYGDCHKTDLSHANLYSSIFSRYRFEDTTLDYANLSEASFIDAFFTHCSMQHANLAMANFSSATFRSHSDLSHVNATRAKFIGSNLTNVNLTGAILPGRG